MSSKQNLDPVFEQIKRDAAEQCIDFDEPANLFTLWAGGIYDRKQYCGSRQDLDAASRLAARHEGLKELYIVHAGPMAFGIMRFEKNASLIY